MDLGTWVLYSALTPKLIPTSDFNLTSNPNSESKHRSWDIFIGHNALDGVPQK